LLTLQDPENTELAVTLYTDFHNLVHNHMARHDPMPFAPQFDRIDVRRCSVTSSHCQHRCCD
jgi:hypothetical protein